MLTRYWVYENGDNSAAKYLFAVFRSSSEGSSIAEHIDEFTRSPAGTLWSSGHYSTRVVAGLGEYGYIERDGAEERFVCLGHINNILGVHTDTTVTLHRRRRHDGVTPWQEVHGWPNGVFR